jgi:sugar-specific transcriptional regulator TrmB
MSEMDRLDLLMGLGLSPNQAKVYQTLLKVGDAKVGDIAKWASVRREDVYKVLPVLEKMGLIEKLLGKPAIIRVTPVAGALTSLILNEKIKSDERIASMKEKFRTIAKVQWKKPISLVEEESQYALIPEGKAVIAKLTRLIVSSKTSFVWISSLKDVSHITALCSAEIKRAIHDGVAVRIIIENLELDDSRRQQVQGLLNIDSASARFDHQPLNRFAVFDSREAMISTYKKDDFEDTSALWTTDINLIGVLSSYFEAVWSESKELGQVIHKPS